MRRHGQNAMEAGEHEEEGADYMSCEEDTADPEEKQEVAEMEEVDLSGYDEACQVELSKFYNNDKRKYKELLDWFCLLTSL